MKGLIYVFDMLLVRLKKLTSLVLLEWVKWWVNKQRHEMKRLWRKR